MLVEKLQSCIDSYKEVESLHELPQDHKSEEKLPQIEKPTRSLTRAAASVIKAYEDEESSDSEDFEANDDSEEVIVINYNRSNTPKYVGKFTNVIIDNKLKRQCKKCPAIYTDLKGFNRHYQKKHLK